MKKTNTVTLICPKQFPKMEYDEIVVTLIVVLAKGLEWRTPSREFLLDLWNLIPESALVRVNIFKAAVAAASNPPVYTHVGQDGKTELTFEFGHRFEQPSGSPRPPHGTGYNFMQNEVWSIDHRKVIVNLSGQVTGARKPPDPVPSEIVQLWSELTPEDPLTPERSSMRRS